MQKFCWTLQCQQWGLEMCHHEWEIVQHFPKYHHLKEFRHLLPLWTQFHLWICNWSRRLVPNLGSRCLASLWRISPLVQPENFELWNGNWQTIETGWISEWWGVCLSIMWWIQIFFLQSEIHPSMKAVLSAVKGWEARDAVLLRVGIFLREDSTMVEVKEREAFENFWENEKMRVSWVLMERKKCSGDKNG